MADNIESPHEQSLSAGNVLRLVGSLGLTVGLLAWGAICWRNWSGLQVEEVRDVLLGSLLVFATGQWMCDWVQTSVKRN